MVDSIRHILPLWAVALVIAAAAPWWVRAAGDLFEGRARKRAVLVVARARARARRNERE
jgi:hypothetical protein